MKKSRSLFEAFRALKNLVQVLFKKMPVLFLVLIYLVDLGIRSYLSEGFSTTYLLGLLILLISIGIYVSTKSFSETTLSFVYLNLLNKLTPKKGQAFSKIALEPNFLVPETLQINFCFFSSLIPPFLENYP